MCRLAAFPPQTSREKAIEILLEFEKTNTDGTGYVYLKDGKFVISKWPKSLTRIVKRERENFLSHMPHDGWTLAHLRAASHGENTEENTHPFIINNFAIVHNGIWSDYRIAQLAMSKYISPKGETDSEVAGLLIDSIGPKIFYEEITHAGVFLCLYENGELWAIKTSGELVSSRRKGGPKLLASELRFLEYPNQKDLPDGLFHYDKNGFLIEKIVPKNEVVCRYPVSSISYPYSYKQSWPKPENNNVPDWVPVGKESFFED